MGSVSSEEGSDQQSERCGSYSLSADVSESESSSSSFSCRRYDAEGASSSMASSPLACRRFTAKSEFPTPMLPPFMFPVIGGKDVLLCNGKSEKRQADLSECLLDCLDLSSEHHTLEVANRIEAAVYVWRLKDQKKHPHKRKSKRKSWGGKVKGLVADGDKNQYLAERAETLLHSLRLRVPGLPQK